MKKITVKRTYGRDFRFTGELISSALSSRSNTHPHHAGKIGNWQELNLFGTKTGKYVCQIINCTKILARRRYVYDAKVCDTVDEVIDFFGSGALADELFKAADIAVFIDLD